MKQYKPNFKDRRTLSRVKHAYGFTKAVMSEDKETNWSSRTIDKYFGQHQHKLSKYLRKTLLICFNDRYDMHTGKCKSYKINPYGLSFLREILLGNTSIVQLDSMDDNNNSPSHYYPSVSQVGMQLDRKLINNWCIREFGEELRTMNFNYKDKSNRLWHPIQNIKKENKKIILAEMGLGNHYDIEACAPNLIKQYAEHTGMNEPLTALSEYLTDKTNVRTRISKQLEVPIQITKVIINALFCGARVGNNPDFAISQLLNHDNARITWLKEDPYIIQLRADIKTCWDYIEPHLPKRYITTKNGIKRKAPLTSKRKWNLYFEQERKVLNQVKTYLQLTSNRCFLEHDGFVTEYELDIDDLKSYIENTTDYNLNFKHEIVQLDSKEYNK
jgi:hypothetical protein